MSEGFARPMGGDLPASGIVASIFACFSMGIWMGTEWSWLVKGILSVCGEKYSLCKMLFNI